MDGPSQPAGMVCASLTALGVGAWLTLGGKKKLPLEVCLDINSDTIDAASAVGGKALGLAECVKAGARVPAAFAVPVAVFDAAAAATGAAALISAAAAKAQAGDDAAALSELSKARAALRTCAFDDALRRDVATLVGAFGDRGLACRSSAVAEDGAGGSFAGQLETVLNCKTEAEVLAGILDVWCSALGEGVAAYLGAKLDAAALHCGVVVQAQVDSRAAKGCEIPNFKGSDLGHFPLVSANFWTSDHPSERPRSVDAFFGTRARGTLTLKRR
jgi:hypothetical protein